MSGYWGLLWGEKKPLRFDIECLTRALIERAEERRGGGGVHCYQFHHRYISSAGIKMRPLADIEGARVSNCSKG